MCRTETLRSFAHVASGMLIALCAACSPNMRDQPKYKPLAKSEFFTDGRAARSPLPGTVARGQLKTDRRFHMGKVEAGLVGTVPFPVDRGVLARGQERFGIFCTPCHGMTGEGDGMAVQRGFRRPPSLHIDRLRDAPDGHYFDVMTAGYGAMASYASRIPPRDRWEITAYIRALQLSQNAKIEDVPEAERQRLLERTK